MCMVQLGLRSGSLLFEYSLNPKPETGKSPSPSLQQMLHTSSVPNCHGKCLRLDLFSLEFGFLQPAQLNEFRVKGWGLRV